MTRRLNRHRHQRADGPSRRAAQTGRRRLSQRFPLTDDLPIIQSVAHPAGPEIVANVNRLVVQTTTEHIHRPATQIGFATGQIIIADEVDARRRLSAERERANAAVVGANLGPVLTGVVNQIVNHLHHAAVQTDLRIAESVVDEKIVVNRENIV